MADYYASLGANAQLHLQVYETGTSIPGNYSTVHANLWIERTAGTGRYSNYTDNSWSMNIGGQVVGGSGTYDLRSGSQLKMSNDFTIGHNADGTATIGVSGSFSDPHGNIGSGTASGSLGLSTIPRASTPSFSPNPCDAGATVTINTNRASSGFTHTISYKIGSSTGTIGTGIGASTTWDIPLSLLTEIPNSTSGSITITTQTYNGATLIGTTTATLTMRAPTSVIPTLTDITNSDTNSSVVSIVGAYVQGLSTLALAITGAAGVYGSTISSYKITVAGQTINAVSGTTTPIGASGTVPIVATVTDSRGRVSDPMTVNVTVLAYTGPQIDSSVFQLRRSDVSGTLDPAAGTYVRTDLKASVQSLIVGGTEKNALTYKIESRQRGLTSWTTKTTVTPGGVTFNSYDVEGTYAVEDAWEFQVTVSDKFGSVVTGGTIATAAIFMHWNASVGLAIGKFWEQGALDVMGQIYQNDGKRVLDEDDITTLENEIIPRIEVLENDFFQHQHTNTLYIPLNSYFNISVYPRTPEDWNTPLGAEHPMWATKNKSGIVTFGGMVTPGAAVSSGTLIMTLPSGYRPSTKQRYPIWTSAGRLSVIIDTDGTVVAGAAIASGTAITFANVVFFEASQEPTWVHVTSLLNGWTEDTNYGPIGYAVDSYGDVWLRGMAVKSGTWTDGSSIFALPAGLYPSTQYHLSASSGAGYGYAAVNASGTGNPGVSSKGAVAGANLSLAGIVFSPAANDSLWSLIAGGNYTQPLGNITLRNSWAYYGSNGVPAVRVPSTRDDGLVMIRGLYNAGTIGSVLMALAQGMRPFSRLAIERPSSAATGQLYINGPDPGIANAPYYIGGVIPQAGSNTWFSLDGVVFQQGA